MICAAPNASAAEVRLTASTTAMVTPSSYLSHTTVAAPSGTTARSEWEASRDPLTGAAALHPLVRLAVTMSTYSDALSLASQTTEAFPAASMPTLRFREFVASAEMGAGADQEPPAGLRAASTLSSVVPGTIQAATASPLAPTARSNSTPSSRPDSATGADHVPPSGWLEVRRL